MNKILRLISIFLTYSLLLASSMVWATPEATAPTETVTEQTPTAPTATSTESTPTAPVTNVTTTTAPDPATVQSTQPTTTGEYSITTTPGNYVWPTQLQVTTPNILFIKTTLKNGPTPAPAPYAVIALSQSNNDSPAYAINIAYQPATGQNPTPKYTFSVIKRGQGTMPGSTTDITAAWQTAWSYLEEWRTGIEKTFMITYLNGAITVSTNQHAIWYWQDTTPSADITRVSLSSATTPLQYSRTTVTNALTANTASTLTLNKTTPTIVTFRTTELPSTMTYQLLSNATNTLPTYEVTFSTVGGCYTRIAHRSSPTTSDLLTSNGTYEINSPVVPAPVQTYFFSYVPSTLNGGTVSFGIINDSAIIPLLSWTAPQASETPLELLTITTSSNTSTFNTTATALNQPSFAPLGLTKSGTSYVSRGLAKAVAYSNATDMTWQDSIALSQADNGYIQFDLQLTNQQNANGNGAVILLGTQAQGQPLYGVLLEPDTDQPRALNAPATRARFRVFTLAQGTLTYLPSEALVNGHQLSGSYKVSYVKNGTDGLITIEKIDSRGSLVLAKLSIPNVVSGIAHAAVSSDRESTTYTNIQTAPAQTAGPTIGTIVRTVDNPFDFNWNDSSLQRAINTDAGFTFESTITFSENSSYKTVVLGFGGATINPDDCCRFNIQNRVFTGFNGAKIIALITVNQETTDITLYRASVNNQTSIILAHNTTTTTPQSYPTKLWCAYANTDADTESISIGLGTDVYTQPLYTWNNTKTQSGSNFVKNNFKKIALSSWTTGVTYRNITLSPYSPPAQNTPPAPVVETTPPVVAAPNTLTRAINAPLTYDWTLTKTTEFPNGVVLDATGGYLSALVKINSVDPATSIATIMIGLSSDTAKTTGMRANNITTFLGADYNIQLQTTQQSFAPGFICIKKPATTNDSPEIGAQPVPELQQLLRSTPGTTTYATHKIWARYTPYNNNLYFDVGIVPATDTTDINLLEPLYSYVEPISGENSAPLKAITISSWSTSVEITNIMAKSNGSTPPYNGTLVSQAFPLKSQWNLNTTPPTCYEIKPETIHQFAITGTANDTVVLALCKNTTEPATLITTNPIYRLIITPTGIKLVDPAGAEKKASTEGGLLTSATPAPNGLYWITANKTTISIGGYKASDNSLITYLSWGDSTLGDAKSWYITSGKTETSTVEYKSAEQIQTTPTTGVSSAPRINRMGQTVGSTTQAPRSIRAAQTPRTPQPIGSNRQVRSSTDLNNRLFQRNTEIIAR